MSEEAQPSWQALRDEAALWLARMDSGSASLTEFEAWRDSNPRHAPAFVQVAAPLGTLERVKGEAKSYFPQPRRSHTRRNLIAAAVAVAFGSGVGLLAVSNARAKATTAVGERKTIRFPKGGRLELNTDSEAKWRDSGPVIEVWLERGEVSLDLIGSSQTCRLHAVGRIAEFSNSRINARLRGKLVDLSVIHGTCTVGTRPAADKTSGASATIAVLADHAVVASAGEAVVRPLADADIQALSSWPDGELVFEGQSLETAVSEYNRYLTRKIVIVDPALNPIRLGGRFTSQDPSAFLEALRAGFGIRVVDDGSNTIALTKS